VADAARPAKRLAAQFAQRLDGAVELVDGRLSSGAVAPEPANKSIQSALAVSI
jgi:hypothetical protein